MKCIYLKQKLNRKLECKKDKNKIIFIDCVNCPFKEYHFPDSGKTIKSRSSRLAKLERNRESLFTQNMDKCYFCGKKKEHIHEVIFGKNRTNSMKYGLTLPLCSKHHQLMHKDKVLIAEYKKKGQLLFSKNYPNLDFEDIFKRNYL